MRSVGVWLICVAGCGRLGFDAAPVADGSVCTQLPDVTDGLVLHWQFEDEPTSLVVRDSSGNGNDGALINAPLFTTGRFGQGMEFGGMRNGNEDQRLRSDTTTFDSTGDLQPRLT